jgi:hypothetical protein
LLSGAPGVTYLPILCVAAECVLFVLLALWRFNKDEF